MEDISNSKEQSRIPIDISKYHDEGNSHAFTNRDIVKNARIELKLDEKDYDTNTYLFLIPEDTTEISNAFIFHLLSFTILNIPLEALKEKYQFDLSNITNEEIKISMEEKIKSGINQIPCYYEHICAMKKERDKEREKEFIRSLLS